MRIATWNVNGLKAREEKLLRWLAKKNSPDIVCLQETRTGDQAFLRRFRSRLQAEDYHAAFHVEPRRNGVAILSRHPIRKERRGLPRQQSLGARLLTAEIAGMIFTTVYVPSAGKSSLGMRHKLAWLDALLRQIGTRANDVLPSVLCGDFNITPAPVDNWRYWDQRREDKSKPGFRDDERSRIRSLGATGWFDLVRAANPGRRMFSYWNSPKLYRQDKGLRIDLVFGNRAVREGLKGARTDRSPLDQRDSAKRRDHAPVIVDLA